ncbi:MAG: hypothetical protein R6X23_08965 [Acidimicrobiia bacterium]
MVRTLARLPNLSAMVTGGVGIEDVPVYLGSGARVVGVGAVFGDDEDDTRHRVARLMASVR